jgi:DNA-directed RNA polymerase subunit RPC12/RpoP
MRKMSKEQTSTTTRISSIVLLIILLTLAFSFTALVLALNIFATDQITAGWLILIGFVGVGISTYWLLQLRRRVTKMKIELPPITTTIECRKCGFKKVREFQRGDYIFKEVEGDQCQKCNEKMMITAIYREVKDTEKERSRF